MGSLSHLFQIKTGKFREQKERMGVEGGGGGRGGDRRRRRGKKEEEEEAAAVAEEKGGSGLKNTKRRRRRTRLWKHDSFFRNVSSRCLAAIGHGHCSGKRARSGQAETEGR